MTAAGGPTRRAPVVEVADLARAFPGDPPVDVLRGVNLRIEVGEYVSITGPSGSGKSTLLHLIGLLDRPTSGTYLLDGVDTRRLTERRRAHLRGARIGFIFQAFHLLGHRSLLDNVALGGLYSGLARRPRMETAALALGRVGLAHRLHFSPSTLSGGERQRAAVARALVARPALLLADEPTGNLDTASADTVLDLFEDLHAEGITVVVITHDERVSRRAERRIGIVDGRLVDEL